MYLYIIDDIDVDDWCVVVVIHRNRISSQPHN